jgi:glyoxylase-like metal-dependent hydrolase (beta-lactamase superfamily II)
MSARLAATGGPAWSGGSATAHATCLLAPNPSVMTLDGTNTWLVGDPASGQVVVVDPGPLGGGHGEAISEQLAAWDARAGAILLTHGHLDHSSGAAELARRLGCGVRALDPLHRLGGEGLVDGDVVALPGDVVLRVVATPGHSADSLSFLLEPDAALLTGDTVLGRGTTVVAHPDGRLRDYLASLERLRTLAQDVGAGHVLPGHGPAQDDPVGLLAAYLEHRAARLDQVRAAVAAGAATVEEVVAVVYADVPRAAWPAAALSVAAQLAYLRGED